MWIEKKGTDSVSAVASVIGPTTHRVLYHQASGDANWHPVASAAEGDHDPIYFHAIMIELINKARHSGAPRPSFREQTEIDGKPEVT